ncbi:MAG: hypothetical protein Ta2B_22610 [Termitinemataceae bacterium]|nr:MAG: hypothetical protein Ta2B_22610 [Termitinemataceae bacterium]
MKKYFTFAVFFLICTAAFSQSNMDTVAVVNLTKSEPITVKQLRTEVERAEKMTGKTLTLAERKEVLDGMINNRLMLQQAEKEGLRVSDEEINQQINSLKAQMAQQLGRAPTESEFTKALQEETGMTLPAFREEGKKQLLVQQFIMKKKGDTLQNIKKPSEKEVKEEYELYSSQFVQDQTAIFTAILFTYKDAGERSTAKTNADKLAKEINGNLTVFDEKVEKGLISSPSIAYKSTKDGKLAKNATALNLVGKEFMDAVFALPQGKVSDVIEVPKGSAQAFYIVKITGNLPAKILSLDEHPLNAPGSVTVRQLLEEAIMRRNQQQNLMNALVEITTELRKDKSFTVNEKNLEYK